VITALLLFAGCIPNIPRGTIPVEHAAALPATVVLREGDAADVYFSATVAAGSAWDSPGQEGISALTARAMVEGGAGARDPDAVRDLQYLVGNTIEVVADKDRVTFRLRCHRDQASLCSELFADVLTVPRFDPDAVKRLVDQAVFALHDGAAEDEEALAYEVLDDWLFEGRPYGHPSLGRWGALPGLQADDLRGFHQRLYLRAATVVGVAGAADEALVRAFVQRFEALPSELVVPTPLLRPPVIAGRSLLVVQTASPVVGFRLGHPIDVDRDDPDYPALYLAMTALGAHRQSFGRLFREVRGKRGLNYGTYAYMEPYRERIDSSVADEGVARRQGMFHVWIRPTSEENAAFALKLTLAEVEDLVANGLTQDELDSVRAWITGSIPGWYAQPGRRLAAAVEATSGGWPDPRLELAERLAGVTVDDVKRVLALHVHPADLRVVAVGASGGWVDAVLGAAPTPMIYQGSQPDAAQAARDADVASRSVGFGSVTRVAAEDVFR
jgi:zinc protease